MIFQYNRTKEKYTNEKSFVSKVVCVKDAIGYISYT